MDFSKIKKIIKSNGDKFIVVEEGEPELVIMSFEEYEKLASLSGMNRGHGYEAALADLEMERMQEKEVVTKAAMDSGGLPARLEDIKLEDLPI